LICGVNLVKDELKMKSMVGNLTRAKNTLLLTGLAFGLTTCGLTQPQETTVASGAQGGNTATTRAVSTNASNAVPELAARNPVEQQRLIDEINRDGNALNFPDFREEIPAPVAPEGEDIVELNYEQADLRLVLEELADAIDITVVIDPGIDDSVSIRTSSNRPLSRDDIWPLIRLLTRNAGITLEQLGDFYTAYREDTGLPVEIVTPETVGNTLGTTVMQVTPLTYISTDSAMEVLSPMLEVGAIIKLASRNVLAINGTRSQLNRVNQLLTLIDSDPFANQGIQLYRLSNASAEEVATELSEILTLIEGNSPSYQVKGIERINAILVTAPAARGFAEVARWVQILDADNQEQVEQLFYYQVKNLNAIDLADTLSNVFEENDEDVIPRLLDPRDVNLANAEAPLSGRVDGGAAAQAATANDAQASDNEAAVSANIRVRIVADENTNSLLIRSTARDYRQLLTTINQLDSVPLQVMVNAVIAQVTLNEETKFGVDWSRVAADAAFDDISTSTSTGFVPQLGGLMFSKSFVDGSALIEATLDAIASNNEVRLLARPSLTVINNQEGEIQIGADVPIEAGQSISNGGISTTNIQYRPTGIELYITPQINNDGIVNLTIRQVLSSVDNSAAGVNNNPVFNNQEISTTVVVRDSENVVLGGLIQTDNQLLNTGVPGLNRIPLLGNLFSYQQELQERRELFIVLRPEIVNLNEESSLQYTDILQRFELAAEMFDQAGI